jgi:hypothetical protein
VVELGARSQTPENLIIGKENEERRVNIIALLIITFSVSLTDSLASNVTKSNQLLALVV